MLKEIWDLVGDLVDSRYQKYDEKKYEKEVDDIKGEIEALAAKIESDLDAEAEHIRSGDAKHDAECDKAGV